MNVYLEINDGMIRGYNGESMCFIHPKTFIELYGKDAIRKLPKDISDEQLEEYLATIEG